MAAPSPYPNAARSDLSEEIIMDYCINFDTIPPDGVDAVKKNVRGFRYALIFFNKHRRSLDLRDKPTGQPPCLRQRIHDGLLATSLIVQVNCGSCCCCLKKNLNAPRPSEHPPVWGKKCQNV